MIEIYKPRVLHAHASSRPRSKRSGFKLVPNIVAGGRGDSGGNSLVNVLLAGIVRDQMNNGVSDTVAMLTPAPPPPPKLAPLV